MNKISVQWLVGFVLGYAVMTAIIAAVLMVVWNYSIPHITGGHLHELTFWRAVALSMLVSYFKSKNQHEWKW